MGQEEPNQSDNISAAAAAAAAAPFPIQNSQEVC